MIWHGTLIFYHGSIICESCIYTDICVHFILFCYRNQSDPTLLEMICNTYQTVTTNGLRSALYLEEDVAITMTHLHQSL